MFSNQDADNSKKQGAKQGINPKEGTNRRERQLRQVRHRATGEALHQLRRHDDSMGSEAVPVEGSVTDLWELNSSSPPSIVSINFLPECARLVLQSQNSKEAYHGTMLIRKMLSVERNPPFSEVIQSGVVPRLVEFLGRDDYPELQFEAAWALTNIAAGTTENTKLLIQYGAVPFLVSLLRSPNVDCRDQAAWALGNLGGEGAECRDAALNCGALPMLLDVLVTPGQELQVVRNAVWAVSNLCRGKPLPPLDVVGIAVPVLAPLLSHSDSQVVVDAAWGLSYISEGDEERVQLVVDGGIVLRVIELTRSPTHSLKMPAMRILGNIASGNDEQTQVLINNGALYAFEELLRHTRRNIRKEACWTVSNIAAGHSYQIEALIQAGVFIPVLECMMAPELDVKKEAVWTIANVTFCGSPQQSKYLISIGVIPPLCDVLRTYDAKILSIGLEALKVLLQIGELDKNTGITPHNMVAAAVTECGGLENLEVLQNHSSEAVYQAALSLLEGFFSIEGDVGMDQGGAEGAYMEAMNMEGQFTF